MSSEMSVVISPSCSTTSESSRARSSGGSVRSPASTSMFVRTLVSGVRSSCDASATSWRCARVDSSRAPSIALKLAASRLSSSFPSTSMRSERSWVSLTRSTVSVSWRTGVSAARATTSPRPAAMTTPPAAISRRKSPMRSSDSSTSLSGRATWTAAPGPYANVKTRMCFPSTVHVLPERRALLAGDGEDVVVDGELDLLPAAARGRSRPFERAARSLAPRRTRGGRRGRLPPWPGITPSGWREISAARASSASSTGRTKLLARDEVEQDRRGDDRERDRRSGRDGDAGAERHDSRSAYPTPRTVWMIREAPPSSVLRRRYPM